MGVGKEVSVTEAWNGESPKVSGAVGWKGRPLMEPRPAKEAADGIN